MDDVAPADPRAVQEVIALAVALHTPLDGDLVIVDRKPACGVVEVHRDLGVGGPRAALAAGVDDLLHLLAANVARLARAEHPLDGVDDVGLAGAVRPDDRSDAAFESDLGRPGKGLEAQQAQ